jgi:hypothetical protein
MLKNKIMKKLFLLIAFTLLSCIGYSQNDDGWNLIGYHKSRLMKTVETLDFKLKSISEPDKEGHYEIIYVNNKLPLDLVYYFDSKFNMCGGAGIIIEDKSYVSAIRESLDKDSNFTKKSTNIWSQTKGDTNYDWELVRQKNDVWCVIIQPESK